jgi:integrase-like protein
MNYPHLPIGTNNSMLTVGASLSINRAADDWVFASPAVRGQKPYWGQCLMRTIIRPAATKVGIAQHIGWHTFRHTYSSLLRANRTDIKVTQELLRHASSRSHWVHIPKPSQFRSGVRRAASFVPFKRLQRLLVETGLLEVFLNCACSKWRDRCEILPLQ